MRYSIYAVARKKWSSWWMIDDQDRCGWVNVSSGTGSPSCSWSKGCKMAVVVVTTGVYLPQNIHCHHKLFFSSRICICLTIKMTHCMIVMTVNHLLYPTLGGSNKQCCCLSVCLSVLSHARQHRLVQLRSNDCTAWSVDFQYLHGCMQWHAADSRFINCHDPCHAAVALSSHMLSAWDVDNWDDTFHTFEVEIDAS